MEGARYTPGYLGRVVFLHDVVVLIRCMFNVSSIHTLQWPPFKERCKSIESELGAGQKQVVN